MKLLTTHSHPDTQSTVECSSIHLTLDAVSDSREKSFLELVECVTGCSICPRMSGRTRVLSKHNGSIHAEILFIAEAPGRFGADAHNIPLYGDQTGRNFETLMQISGLQREKVFITNAVLCNPRDEAGRNATPSKHEVNSCARHLQATIELIQPSYIVTLGSIALQALHSIKPHTISLSKHVGKCCAWNERLLIPLYHPGARARIHRSFDLQVSDFMQLVSLTSNM